MEKIVKIEKVSELENMLDLMLKESTLSNSGILEEEIEKLKSMCSENTILFIYNGKNWCG